MTYNTEQAAKKAGVSYRMLDYWLRIGAVKIEVNASGSGSRRVFSEAEVEALCAVVAMYRAAQTVLRDFSSGLLWEMEVLANDSGAGDGRGERATGDAAQAGHPVRGRARRGDERARPHEAATPGVA